MEVNGQLHDPAAPGTQWISELGSTNFKWPVIDMTFNEIKQLIQKLLDKDIRGFNWELEHDGWNKVIRVVIWRSQMSSIVHVKEERGELSEDLVSTQHKWSVNPSSGSWWDTDTN
jgi:hypothetical protein